MRNLAASSRWLRTEARHLRSICGLERVQMQTATRGGMDLISAEFLPAARSNYYEFAPNGSSEKSKYQNCVEKSEVKRMQLCVTFRYLNE
jgi:hypothetical protein